MSEMKYSRASRSGNIPENLSRARASPIWGQHPPHPYTPVHNAASTDEVQTCLGRLQSYEVGDGAASRAAGVRLKKVRSSGLRCVITGRTLFSFWPSEASREPRVLLEE